MKNHYDTLGLKKDAKEAQIKKAYYKLALEWHPDKNEDRRDAAIEEFHKINEAYTTLSHIDSKKNYDHKLKDHDNLEYLLRQLNKQRSEPCLYETNQFESYLTKEEEDVLNNFKNRMDQQECKSKKIRKKR